jgi:hypothetical protein
MQIDHLIICCAIAKGELEELYQQPLLKLCNVMPSNIDLPK